ncbi:RHS repeat-associated core domain-containing protein [Sporocytophaga myxococcoides]|uniref:RHS repeat-associated core domain-containing protein n=1 Tax=Sporocytophaga myxococcoides TaxID=153721 RepID=UPI0004054866|nr:RHS repeat-associated core domain-containing protein [Sporocytophaga myxococcoides]
MKSLRILLGLLFASLAAYSQNCNITIVPTGVTCFGGKDGKAEIHKDGKLVVLDNGGTCVTPEISSYSCGTPVSGAIVSNATSGLVEIPDGKTLYLTSPSFNGSVRFLGTNTLVVCGGATITNFEMNNNSKPITIIINGQATLTSPNINLDYQSVLKNYGNLSITNTIGFNGKLYNHGVLTATQTLNINANTGQFYNAGRVQVGGTFNNYNTATNGGTMEITGDFNNNGGSGFINLCKINVGNSFSNSTTIENYGKIAIGNLTNITGGKLYKGYSNSLLSTKDLTVDGVIDGVGTTCAAVKVSRTTTINGSGVVKGLTDLCDANGIETVSAGTIQGGATTNCSCNATGAGSGVSGTITWSSGTPMLGGSTVTGLAANTYNVSVNITGCNAVNQQFTIPTPNKIMATVSVNGGTATVSTPTGGNQGQFYYDWKLASSTEITTTTTGSKFFSTPGNYTVTVRDSKGCTGDPLPFTIVGQGTTCNFTVVTTPVTCYGGNDGKVVVYKDGVPIDVPVSQGGGSGGSSDLPTGNPGSCMTQAVSSYSCSSIPSGAVNFNQSSGTVSIAAGQTVYITSPSFTGDLSVAGGTLIVCGNATIQNFNYSGTPGAFTLIVNGTAKLNAPNLNLLANSTVKNYGILTTSSIGFNGALENHGTITVNGDLSFNTSANSYLNTGTITVTGNFNNKFTTINGGTFNVKGIFNNNEPTSLFRNYCKLFVDGSLNNNKDIENKGYIIVATSTTTFNSNSVYKGYAGSVLYTLNFINNGLIDGLESCASIRVKQNTNLTGSSIIKGNTFLCDANGVETGSGQILSPAALNCSCGGTSTTTSTSPIVWTGYPNVTGNTNSNLSAGTNTVVINWPGCSQSTLTYIITQPLTGITATVSVNGGTATVSTPSGGNGGQYKYKWSDGTITNVGSRNYTTKGNYSVRVLDSKNCEGPELPFSITNIVETECNIIVSYQVNEKVLIKIECPDTSCKYRIRASDGNLLPYASLINRPCKDSIITSVNCNGDIIQTGIKGSGRCVPFCNPATDPNCPCNLATDPGCSPQCNPTVDPDCPCLAGLDPNCQFGCDQTDPLNCPCDPNSGNCPPCDPSKDTGCPTLGVTYQAYPEKCGTKPYVILTITNGSGNYTVVNKNNKDSRGGGSSPVTMYNLAEGESELSITDNISKVTREIIVKVDPAPKSTMGISATANAGSECKNQLSINITNAVSGPYRLDLGCCIPSSLENLTATSGNLQLGPYTIPNNIGDGPFMVKITDSYCNTYSDLVTPCNIVCNTPESNNYQPQFTKIKPSYKGKTDGSIILTNPPANVTAYWTGTNIYSPVQGTTLSYIGEGSYSLLLVNNITKCTYYYSPVDETLEDGPINAARFTLVAGCNYEAKLSKVNEDGSANATPVAEPITYTWYNPANNNPVGSGKQINISAIASSLSLDYLNLVTTDGQGNTSSFTFEIPNSCIPPTVCNAEIRYKLTDPLCHDGTNGSITITSIPNNYYIAWVDPALQATGANASIKSGLKGGRYSLSVIPNNTLCKTETVDIILDNPASLEISKEELSTGGVKIIVSKGKKDYHIVWTDNNQDIAQRTDLVPGTSYTVNVTDANNCPGTFTFVYNPCAVSKPEPLVELKGTTATVINSSGLAPFTYNWKGGDIFDRSLKSQDKLPSGTYEVVVTDKRGCKDSVEFNSNKCGQTINVTVTSQDTRSDLCNGQAVLSLTGITNYDGYAILWDKTPLENYLKYQDLSVLKNQSTVKFLNACAGKHTVAVITPGGCVVESPFEVKYTSVPPVNCSNNPLAITNLNGTSFTRTCYSEVFDVNFYVSGGTPEYTYDWSVVESGGATRTFASQNPGLDNPDPGTYTVKVTDANLCTVTGTYTVTGPSSELIFTQQSQSPVCAGLNGTLILNISGGVAPYKVTWADATFTTTSTGIINKELAAGVVQSFTVSDSKNCSKPGDVFINDTPFEGKIYYNRLEFCPGKDPVSLTAATLPSYTFKWTGTGINANNQYESQVKVGTAGIVNLVYTPKQGSVCTLPFTKSVTISERSAEDCKPSNIMCDVVDIEVPGIITVNQCNVTIKNVDTSNVEAAYYAYIQEAKKKFVNDYVSSVMDSLKEELTIDYSDSEQHYTLYYYDQAGNLVRTVPPAGVTPLSESITAGIITDLKDKKVPNVYTDHNLSTTYKYNSLNQLISQDMPDHSRQDLWETKPALTLPNGYSVGAIDYVTAQKGLLFANTSSETKLYKTTDTGKEWTANMGLEFGDILDINTVTGASPAYFAVGKNGLFIKGSNNGSEWTLFSSPTSLDLIDVYFTTSSSGRIMAYDGTLWTTTDGGVNWSSPNYALKNTNIVSITDVWNDNNQILVAGTKGNPAVSVLYMSTDGGSIFNIQEFGAGPYSAIANDGTNTFITGSNGVILKVSNGKFSVWTSGNVQKQFRQLIVKSGNYTALMTDAGNPQGNVYTSSDGKSWTAVTSGSDILRISELSGSMVSAVSNSGNYANSNNWSSFGTVTVNNNTTPPSTTQLNNITKSMYVAGTLFANNGTAVSDREVILASSLAYRTGTNSWQKIDITGYNAYTTKSLIVNATHDWLLLGGDNNLYRTKLNTGTVPNNTLILTNSNNAVVTGVYEIYKTSDGVYALKTDNTIVKLTLNSSGTVTPVNQFTLPSGVNVYMLSDLSLTAGAGGADALATFNDGSVYQRLSGGSWVNKAFAVQPTNLLTSTSSGNLTLYTDGDNSELFKKAIQDNNNFQWTYQKVISTNTVKIKDAYLDAGTLRLATDAGMKTYNTSTFALTDEAGVSGTINEAYGNVAVTETGSIYVRNGSGTWQGSNPDPLNAPIREVSVNLAAGTKNIYYYQGGGWSKALPIKVQPITAMAQGNKLIAVGNQGTVLVSSDLGETWQPKPIGSTQNLSAVASSGDKAVAGSVNGSIFYSNNAGNTWTTVSTPPGTGEVRSIVIIGGTKVWMIKGKSLLYSSDMSNYSIALTATEELFGVHVDADGYGYVVGNGGTAYRLQPVGTFTSSQKTQASCSTPATEPSNLLTGSLSYLKICNDADITDDKGTGMPGRPLRSVSFTDRLTGYITGTSGLVMKTVDGGYRWMPEGTGSGSQTPIVALADAQNGTLVNGNGEVKSLRDRAQQLGSRFWYDELGRLVLSQNSKQYNIENYLNEKQYEGVTEALNGMSSSTEKARAYSYTMYDKIGRIVEVGELITKATFSTPKHESQVEYNAIELTFLTSGVKQQITSTYYDEVVFEDILQGFEQQNLRPRVTSVTYSDKDITDENGLRVYDRATHYSYDIHGNVKTLVQEIKSGGTQATKRMDYEYDLVSGKVNYVYYQKGQSDQLIHKYEYDGDNRITQVSTSTDGVNWVKEAEYDYYAHGPLAQAKIGRNNAEIQTYAYTLQGWIKGVKGDQFSYALGYYDQNGKKDYSTIGGGAQGLQSTPVALNDQGKNTSLYNGNIATWTSLNKEVNYSTVGGQRVYQAWTQQFEYDQLNRIKSGKSLGSDAYKNTYAYDANGNITSLNRYNESGVQFDQLSYNYENKKAGYLANTNKLRSVSDLPSMTGIHSSDVDNQVTDNYEYDEIGNLNKDVQEQIKNIEWTVYGKIKAVTREGGSSKSNLSFEYDASGNRTVKIVTDKDGNVTKTFYIRDAQGNVMSTYEVPTAGSLTLDEQYIYGSSRLGVLRNEVRSYELTDHLGNVRSVIGELRDVNNQIEVISATDYYPFGMIAKSFNSNNYRFGFNGKENIDELDSWQDYGERYYITQLAKFLSVDPLTIKYPWYSPYHFAGNTPIRAIDLDGLEPWMPEWYNTTVRLFNGAENSVEKKVEAVKEKVNQYTENPTEIINDGWQAVKGTGQFLFEGTFAPVYDIAGIETETQKAFNAYVDKTIEDVKNLPNATPEQVGEFFTDKAFELGAAYLLKKTGTPILNKFLDSKAFKKLPKVGTIDPNTIRFTQNDIAGQFKNGKGDLKTFIADLKKGVHKAEDITPIKIVEYDGKIWSLDNRRLYSFQKAGKKIKYEKVDYESVKEEFHRKFTTENDGTSIVVRPNAKQ